MLLFRPTSRPGKHARPARASCQPHKAGTSRDAAQGRQGSLSGTPVGLASAAEAERCRSGTIQAAIGCTMRSLPSSTPHCRPHEWLRWQTFVEEAGGEGPIRKMKNTRPTRARIQAGRLGKRRVVFRQVLVGLVGLVALFHTPLTTHQFSPCEEFALAHPGWHFSCREQAHWIRHVSQAAPATELAAPSTTCQVVDN